MKPFEVIKNIEAEILLKYGRIAAIRNNCQHIWVPSSPGNLSSSSPVCSECRSGRDGWWCEESPSKECDYSRRGGRGYNPDGCRYCHQPEERK